MKTFFSTLLGMLVIVLIAAAIVGYIFWSRVPDLVSNDLSKKLKVTVQIDDILLGWNKIKVQKVEIGNTPQSTLSKAFACNKIQINAPFTRYIDKRIVIDEITVSDIYLGLEFDSPTSAKGNWTEIMKNLQAPKEKKSKTTPKKRVSPPSAPTSPRTVFIHKLILNNINVDVLYRKDGGKVQHLRPISRIELTDISSEGGLPTEQIMNSVLGQMLKSVFEKENLKNMLQGLFQQPGGLQKYIEPFKGFFNKEFHEEDSETLFALTE